MDVVLSDPFSLAVPFFLVLLSSRSPGRSLCSFQTMWWFELLLIDCNKLLQSSSFYANYLQLDAPSFHRRFVLLGTVSVVVIDFHWLVSERTLSVFQILYRISQEICVHCNADGKGSQIAWEIVMAFVWLLNHYRIRQQFGGFVTETRNAHDRFGTMRRAARMVSDGARQCGKHIGYYSERSEHSAICFKIISWIAEFEIIKSITTLSRVFDLRLLGRLSHWGTAKQFVKAVCKQFREGTAPSE